MDKEAILYGNNPIFDCNASSLCFCHYQHFIAKQFTRFIPHSKQARRTSQMQGLYIFFYSKFGENSKTVRIKYGNFYRHHLTK